MNEIFESPEFLAFEKLCHAKKLSFLVSVTKQSSVHKPKKGPQYVMSDFFVHDVPEAWEQSGIRSTPPEVWLNPRPPPPLSLPLSQLVNNTDKLRYNFAAIWNHLHGVMTETYFCPKLYLTRIPRAMVEHWMGMKGESGSSLPPGEFLSCCDLCHFPAFAKWVMTPLAETETRDNIKVQLSFLALMIALAMKLYNLDPEKHIKELVQDRGNEADSDKMMPESNAVVKPDKSNAETSVDESKGSASDAKTSKSNSPDKMGPGPKLRLKPISELKLCSPAAVTNDIEIIPLDETPKDKSKSQDIVSAKQREGWL